MLQADLAGQLMVNVHETGAVELTAQPSGSFLDLPWAEAIEEFKARGIISEDELSRLISDYAMRSQEARQLMLEHLRKRTRELLVEALEQGGTFREFATQINSELSGLGIDAADPAYLQTVFRTNIQTAYGAGRYRALEDPVIRETRPYVQYRTVGDARVRPNHAALDGKVFSLDSDEWRRIAPPGGFGCRCSMVSLTREEFEAEGGVVTETVPEDGIPDEGFDGPPVANVRKSLL